MFVLVSVREGKPRPAMPEVLAERGLYAEMRVLRVSSVVFGEMLLSEAHDLETDLLVMGA